jgi:LPXTG-motif cell wall-anchored protein
MVLGEIVPFEFEVTVGGAAPADSSIELHAQWDTVTTPPSGDFGYSETYLVYCAFVDTADPSTSDPDGDASASFSSSLVGTQIDGVFVVVGLDPGDVVIVEAWVVLDSSVPAGISGNVQSRMVDAQTLTPDVDTINVGAETVNLQPDEDFLRAILLLKLIGAGSDPSQTFDFSGDITATLGDGQVSDPQIVTDGTYTVSETLPSGWADPSIGCDDDDSSGTGLTATYSVELETVICTFTNAEAAATTTTTAATTTSTGVTTTVSPTLPLTGQESTGFAGLAVALLASGGLLLIAIRSRRAGV